MKKYCFAIFIYLIISIFLLSGCTTTSEQNNDSSSRYAVGKIQALSPNSVTLETGSLDQAASGTNSESNYASYFVPENETLTLSIPENNAQAAKCKEGEVVLVSYNNEDVLSGISSSVKDNPIPLGCRRYFGKIESIEDGNVTIQPGTINHTQNDRDENLDVQEHLGQDFIPTEGVEPVKLTVPKDSISLEGLKAGDIVSYRYNDKNILQSIHIPYGYIQQRQFGKIENIDNNKVTLLLGNIDPNLNGGSPSENFVAGTKKITLTSPDSAAQLANLKAGDVVMVRYDDKNTIQVIHIPGQGSGYGYGNGSGHGQGHGRIHNQ